MPALHCPTCRSRLLEPAREAGVPIEACVGCGGLWFEAGDLATAITRHDPAVDPMHTVTESIGTALGPAQGSCPHCRETLSTHRLSDANPLPVDICPLCQGVWVARGGLARAQAGHQLAQARDTIDRPASWGGWFFQLVSTLPIEFNIQPRSWPFATWALLALTAAIFGLQVVTPDGLIEHALYPERVGEARWWSSLLSSVFLHADWIHLIGNLYFLAILGDNVEDLLGSLGFLAFYIAAGVAASLAYTALATVSDQPCVGASGAISAVIAAYAIYFHGSKLTFMVVLWQFKLPVLAYVGIWALFNLAGWLVGSPGVAWEAHGGGLVFGALFAVATYQRLLRARPLLRLLNDVRLDPASGRIRRV